MKAPLAILSDIHSNIDALEAVLADIKEFNPSALVCLGDMVGYGPSAPACVAAMQEHAAHTILGNHESLLLGKDSEPVEAYQKNVAEPILLARKQLTADQLHWLENLSYTAESQEIGFVHASLDGPASFYYIDCPEEALSHFEKQSNFITFHGHTHVPAVWEMLEEKLVCYHAPEKPVKLRTGARYTVNVGSVGQPRDGDPRASYILYDPHARTLLNRRVPYDIDRATRRFHEAGLPRFNASRLSKGR
jgi:diadenosine tetraphosphatase ApaH/serine/threonine PP2A family protein phosphatase